VDQTIRDGRLEDAADIAALLTQLGYPSDEPAVEERIDRLQIVGDRIVVAEIEGKVAGVAHLQVTPALERHAPVARIGALVVDEAYRGQGIGRALVDAVEAEARLRGCELLYVTTSNDRNDARAFYQRLGLEVTGRRYSRMLSE